ncbi:ATP-binding cassette domain-containing protein [Pedobacter fastidiosus]|uniref:ABC transporter ATP-binding protein n=1 Tax=Pedobacter fastidiosus TaxID=2765361 RepID=A0ABR7KST0_9SPHI|nr:ATP-binding cassette domain-containing protein [Pedobacter fastidiosus]MBC6110798.1 ABC transporter ATP-binding protein [Pedobacter fastidiosus]
MLRFHNFIKSYNSRKIVEIGELELSNGIYWLKGINGSGKSTLLKSICGFLHFDGEIFLNEVNLKRDGVDYRKKINFADAEPIYPEFLTGNEMIKLFLKAKSGSITKAEYYINSMDMGNYLNNPLGTYSSGMLKKLSLVLAFLGNPTLICLDEPLITIDIDSLSVLYQWIKDKHEKENTGFILSSHQPFDLSILNNVITLSLENGKLYPSS